MQRRDLNLDQGNGRHLARAHDFLGVGQKPGFQPRLIHSGGIVFLGDTCSMPSHYHDPKLLEIGKDEHAFAWTPGKSDEPKKLSEAREATRLSSFPAKDIRWAKRNEVRAR